MNTIYIVELFRVFNDGFGSDLVPLDMQVYSTREKAEEGAKTYLLANNIKDGEYEILEVEFGG